MTFLLVFLLFFILFKTSAQAYLPVNHYYRSEAEAYLLQNNIRLFSVVNPIPITAVHDTVYQQDSLLGIPGTRPYQWWIFRKLRQENLAVVRSDGLVLKANGLADFSAGRESGSSSLLYRNTRGALFEGTMSNRIGFSSALYENQVRFPAYITSYVKDHKVLPGQGIAKKYGTGGYDFSWVEGNLWAAPAKDLYLETGYGKSFVGDGYRSLLLSDCSAVHPYVGYRWYGKHFFLAATVRSLIQHEAVIRWDKRRFPAKTAMLHFAGIQAGRFQVTLVEANMFENPDSAGRFTWDAALFNPLPVLNSVAGTGNNLWGLNIRYDAYPGLQFYAQLLADDYPFNRPGNASSVRNKTGFQAGAKWFAGRGGQRFLLRAEYNQVRPYTYAAGTLPRGFTHYNEPLAHPLGANFREIVLIASYRKQFWLLEAFFSNAVQGRDDEEYNYGADPFSTLPLPPGVTASGKAGFLQGVRTEILHTSVRASWIVNPVNTLHVSVEYHFRQESVPGSGNKAGIFMVSLRTNRGNHYYDF